MRGTKSTGIGIVLTACVLALLLAGEAGFISVARAGKPDRTRKTSTKYGYARFRDDENLDVIRSDGGGQYVDVNVDDPNVVKEDLVQIVTYDDTGELNFVKLFFGKMVNTNETVV